MPIKVSGPRTDGTEWHTFWEATDYFCPNCGDKKVYENDKDDYYVGCDYLCAGCGASWSMPGLSTELVDHHKLDFEVLKDYGREIKVEPDA